MSWFTEIAGKAENFLNKLDENASIVLSQAALDANGKSIRKSSIGSSIENGHSSIITTVSNVGHASVTSENEIQQQSGHKTDLEFNTSITSKGNIASVSNGKGDVSSSISPSSSSSSKSKSKPNGKKLGKSTSNKKTSATASSSSESNSKLLNSNDSNGSISPSPTPKKSEDDDLIAYLNDSTRKNVDENLVLKNAVANQAREIEMLFKNNRTLQSENDDLLKKILQFDEEKANSAGVEAQVEKAEQDNQKLKSRLKNKDGEIQKLKQSLDQTIAKLQQVEVLQETHNRLEVVEMERNKLVQSNEELKEQIRLLASQLETSENHISSIKNSLNVVETEFTSYKEKAKSILKQKDDLIVSLQECKGDSGTADDSSANSIGSPLLPEINALKSERELLNAEISQSRATSDSFREENSRLELELNSVRSMVSQVQRTLANEKNINSSFQDENLQFRQQVSVLQFELEKEKCERRKLEELKLRSETEESQSARASPYMEQKILSSNNENDDNLRTRITALSQSLLEKQSLINTMSADKQLLQIHVERLQDQMRQMNNEVSSNSSGFSQTVVSNQPLYLSESPWDSGMSMRMKRVYSTVDSLCCQAGVVLRRRPNLRLGFCAYIILLHFWVFFILFHSFSHVPPTNHPSNGPAPSSI